MVVCSYGVRRKAPHALQTHVGKPPLRPVTPDPVSTDRIDSRQLADVCARVIIRDGLTCEQERMWRRLAEPGDPPRDVLDYGMDSRESAVRRAKRLLGVRYGACAVRTLAVAVVEHPDFGKSESLEAENARLRAEVDRLLGLLAERTAAE